MDVHHHYLEVHHLDTEYRILWAFFVMVVPLSGSTILHAVKRARRYELNAVVPPFVALLFAGGIWMAVTSLPALYFKVLLHGVLSSTFLTAGVLKLVYMHNLPYFVQAISHTQWREAVFLCDAIWSTIFWIAFGIATEHIRRGILILSVLMFSMYHATIWRVSLVHLNGDVNVHALALAPFELAPVLLLMLAAPLW